MATIVVIHNVFHTPSLPHESTIYIAKYLNMYTGYAAVMALPSTHTSLKNKLIL